MSVKCHECGSPLEWTPWGVRPDVRVLGHPIEDVIRWKAEYDMRHGVTVAAQPHWTYAAGVDVEDIPDTVTGKPCGHQQWCACVKRREPDGA